MKQTKTRWYQRLFAMLALFVCVCFVGTNVTRVFANDSVVYTSNSVLTSDYTDIGYQEGETYSVTFRIAFDVEVSSYALTVQMPYFTQIVSVSNEQSEGETAVFQAEILDDRTFGVSYISMESLWSTALFTVYFVLTENVNISGMPEVNNMQFQNNQSQTIEGIRPQMGVITVYEQGAEIPPEQPPLTTRLKGDVNGDGAIDLADLMLVQRSLINPMAQLDETQSQYADIDNNTEVNLRDAQFIMMYIAGALGSLEDVNGSGESEYPNEQTYTYEFIIFDPNTKTEMGGGTIDVREGQYVSEVLSMKFHDAIGFYFDMAGTDPVDSVTAPNRMSVIYIFVNSNTETPSDYVNFELVLNVRNLDGTSNNVTEMNGRPLGYTVEALIEQYRNYCGKSYNVSVYADASMSTVLSPATPLENGARYYFSLVEFVPYEGKIVYLSRSNEVILPLTGHSVNFEAGTNIYNVVRAMSERPTSSDSMTGSGMYDYYDFVNIYTDSTLTTPLSTDATVTEPFTVYVEVAEKSLVGEYPLYDENGNALGTATLTAEGTATVRYSATADGTTAGTATEETGTYYLQAGMAFIAVGEYKQIAIEIEVRENIAILYDVFDGSNLSEDFSAVAGTYSVTDYIDEYDITLVYQIELMTNGMFRLSYGKMLMIGSYFYNDNVYTLNEMGSYSQMIKGEDGNFTTSYEYEYYHNYYNGTSYSLRLLLAGVCEMYTHSNVGEGMVEYEYVGTYVREGNNATVTLENGTQYTVSLTPSESEYESGQFTFEGQVSEYPEYPSESTNSWWVSSFEAFKYDGEGEVRPPLYAVELDVDGTLQVYGENYNMDDGVSYVRDGDRYTVFLNDGTAMQFVGDSDRGAYTEYAVFNVNEQQASVSGEYSMPVDGDTFHVSLYPNGLAVVDGGSFRDVIVYIVLESGNIEMEGEELVVDFNNGMLIRQYNSETPTEPTTPSWWVSEYKLYKPATLENCPVMALELYPDGTVTAHTMTGVVDYQSYVKDGSVITVFMNASTAYQFTVDESSDPCIIVSYVTYTESQAFANVAGEYRMADADGVLRTVTLYANGLVVADGGTYKDVMTYEIVSETPSLVIAIDGLRLVLGENNIFIVEQTNTENNGGTVTENNNGTIVNGTVTMG